MDVEEYATFINENNLQQINLQITMFVGIP